VRKRNQEDEQVVDTRGFVEMPFDRQQGTAGGAQGSAVESRRSLLALSALPFIMLVQIECGEEPWELGLAELPVRVLRVRYPLPASVRIRVMRPLAVIIGPTVVERDLPFLFRAADATHAATLQLGRVLARAALGWWLRAAITAVEARRACPF
jgi:hypothetical protein